MQLKQGLMLSSKKSFKYYYVSSIDKRSCVLKPIQLKPTSSEKIVDLKNIETEYQTGAGYIDEPYKMLARMMIEMEGMPLKERIKYLYKLVEKKSTPYTKQFAIRVLFIDNGDPKLVPTQEEISHRKIDPKRLEAIK